LRLAGLCSSVFFASGIAALAGGLTFDAASVKMSGPEVQQPYIIAGGPGTSDPGRFRAPRVDMSYLLVRAFGVSADQLVAPAWIRNAGSPNNFSIMATMPPDTTKEQFQLMLQNLLVERFHLVFHHETRNFPGYELVVDKGGPKFKAVTPAQGDTRDFGTTLFGGMGNAPHGADGFPVFPPGSRVIGVGDPSGQQRMKYQERTMAQFIPNLEHLIGSSQGKSVADGYPQPRVVDKTGLKGKYTFILEFQGAANLRSTPPEAAPDPGNGSPPAANEPDGAFPSIFTAIQEQLGLRLVKTTNVPVDVIVVDSVDKVPTKN